MKNLIEILTESKTSAKEQKNYIKSWLRQDRGNYEATFDTFFGAIIDYFKEEIDWYGENKPEGNEAKELADAQKYLKKFTDIYNNFDEL